MKDPLRRDGSPRRPRRERGHPMAEAIARYLADVQRVLEQVPRQEIARAIEVLLEAQRTGHRIFIMGNGGSAATASHFACDLAKGALIPGQPHFRAIALTDNVPLMTAWANDTAYEHIFAQQLAALVQAGDVVIGISGSGNSANVLNALRLARARSAITIGLTGFDGGKLKELVDICIHVPSFCMEQVEDAHLILAHLIKTCLREALMARTAPLVPAERNGDPFQSLVWQLTHTLGVTVSSLVTRDTDTTLVVQAVSPIRHLERVSQVGRRILRREAPAHWRVLEEGHPVLYRRHEAPSDVSPHELELTLTTGLQSGALLPVQIDGRSLGVVAIGEMRAWERSPFTGEKLRQGLSVVAEWAEEWSGRFGDGG